MRTDMWIYILFDISDIHFHWTESFTRAAMSVYFRKLCTLHNTECHTHLSVHEWYFWGNSRGISTKLNTLWATAEAYHLQASSRIVEQDQRMSVINTALRACQRNNDEEVCKRGNALCICQLRLKSFFNSDGDFCPRPPIRQWGSL